MQRLGLNLATLLVHHYCFETKYCETSRFLCYQLLVLDVNVKATLLSLPKFLLSK